MHLIQMVMVVRLAGVCGSSHGGVGRGRDGSVGGILVGVWLSCRGCAPLEVGVPAFAASPSAVGNRGGATSPELIACAVAFARAVVRPPLQLPSLVPTFGFRLLCCREWLF